VSRLILRVVDAAGARGNSPACGGLKQVHALFSVHLADARRGTKLYKKPEPKKRFKPSAGGCSRPCALRVSLTEPVISARWDARELFFVFSMIFIVVIEADAGSRGDLFDQRSFAAPDPARIDQVSFHELA